MDNRTFGERVSDNIAKFGGSWWFISLGTAIILFWVGMNLSSLDWLHWDNYPFILLNLFLSLIAAFQAPFILMAQRRCEIKQDMAYRMLFQEIKELVETDLHLEQEIIETNKRVEAEIHSIKEMLEEILKNQ